jgi:hypothetical protein
MNKLINTVTVIPDWLWVLLGIGAVSLIASVWTWRSEKNFAERAIHTTGQVTGFVERMSKQRTFFYTKFSFKTTDGRVIEITSRVSDGDKPQESIGDAVPVLYDPEDPQRAHIDDFSQGKLLTWALAIFGGLHLGLGLWKAISLLNHTTG